MIDFGDQIDRALEVVTRFPDVVADHRARFQAVLLDEYQDTNVAQAQLMSALFGAGHPVTAVGDPDQNIYAWRGASLYNLFRFPQEFPKADGTPATQLPLYTNFRSGARILAAADAVIGAVPEAQRPPGKRLVPVRAPTGRARCASCACSTSGPRRGGSPTGASRCTPPAPRGPRWRCCAARRGCSRCCARPSTSARCRSRSSGSPGCCACPRWSRCSRTPARCRTRPPAWRWRASCSAPRYRVGFKDIALARTAGDREDQEPARRLRAGGRRHREPSRCCWPRRSSTSRRSRRCPRKGASGWRGSARSCGRCASRRGGRSASSWAR